MQIEAIDQINEDIKALARAASNDDFGSINTLVSEHLSGVNRFSKSGECLLGVYDAARLVAIGGLNVEVYEIASDAGRIRRFFVHQEWRRQGIGAILLQALETRAKSNFPRLQLFTTSARAAAFYEAMGYERCNRPKVSHQKRLLSNAALF